MAVDGTLFSPSTVDAETKVAYGYFESGPRKGVASLDLDSGRLQVLTSMPAQASGVAWMSYSAPWLVWEQGDSLTNFGNWSINVWNSQTGEVRRLATSQLPDGSYLTGQLAFPIVGHGYAAWSQPTSATSAELRVYSLNNRQSKSLDSGRLSSPVFAGKYLVWGEFADGAREPSFRLADAETLEPLPVPDILSRPRPITYLAGSSDYLLWTESSHDLAVMDWRTGRVSQFRLADDDLRHSFQFPMLAGHFLVWFTGLVNSVMDLDTGNAFEIPLPSGVAGAEDTIVVATARAANTTASEITVAATTSLRSCGG